MNNIFLIYDPLTDYKIASRIFSAISNVHAVTVANVYSETPLLSSEWFSRLQKTSFAILVSDSKNDIHPRVIEFLSQRSKFCKTMKVLDKTDPFLHEHFVDSTANSYVEKDASTDELHFAIEQTLCGNTYISSNFVKFLLKHLPNQKQSRPAKLADLTGRETDVLKLIYKGSTHHQIARKLKIKYNTVLYYTKEIYSKMQVKSKSEAVYQGISKGIL